MFEVEVKIHLKDVNQTRKRLLELNTTPKVKLEHIDRYYNCPQILGDFAKSDEALRLRTCRTFSWTNELIEIQHDLTYKGPKMNKKIKSRVEQVVHLIEAENMDAILTALGYWKVATIDKKREVYVTNFQNKNIEILIDKVEGLSGWFLEAELMATSKKEFPIIQKTLINFLLEIGFSENDCIEESYLELYLEKNT